jgi:hypothetical protein
MIERERIERLLAKVQTLRDMSKGVEETALNDTARLIALGSKLSLGVVIMELEEVLRDGSAQ